jgi:hypothetical protein
MPSLSPAILSIIIPFALLFSRPTWAKAVTLFIGTILCRGKRTVCAALRIMGLSNESNFSKYHHVLNRKRGRKKMKGARLLSFKEMIGMPDLGWTEIVIEGYGSKKKKINYISNTSLWGGDGFKPIPIRWVLVIDPDGELDPLPLMSIDINLCPTKIIALYIQRWNLEVSFEEVREHLGVETQRQWSDKAIARITPILLGFYTIVCLIANKLQAERPIEIAQTAWYEKNDATFSDLLKAVRKILWKDNLIFRKHISKPFRENNKGLDEIIGTEDGGIPVEISWVGLLIEHLAAA